MAGPSSPRINLLPDVRILNKETGQSIATGAAPQTPGIMREPEEDAVEALLVAQRAGIPDNR